MRTENLDLSGLTGLIFHPRHRPLGTVLTVHGASPLGPYDPRWRQLCRGLAHAGFTVLAPLFPSICRLQIQTDQPALVAHAIRAVSAQFSGPPALMSVSLSGGITLIAATQAASGPIMTIGAYGSPRNTLHALIRDPTADWYGLLLTMASLYEPSPLSDALRAIAEDDFHDHPYQPDAYRRWLSAADAHVFDRLLSSMDERKALTEALMDASPIVQALDATRALPKLTVPLTLIHGQDDKVVPPAESVALARQYEGLGRPVRLVLTPLISHGDAQYSRWALLRSAPVLVWAIRDWMRAVARAAAQRA